MYMYQMFNVYLGVVFVHRVREFILSIVLVVCV